MPNLQELLPFFQQLFQHWFEFSMLNAPYAITLGLLVWLLTAIGYSISMGVLKIHLAREVKARTELQVNYDTTQQQLQTTQEQLLAASQQLEQTTQQAETNAQRASGLEQQLNHGNKKLGEGIALLVEKFELIDNAPMPSINDSDGLWQRYGSIVGRIGERFQNEQQAKARLQLDVQAEKSKLADKDAAIANLQGRVDLLTQKLAELEQMAAEQQNLQQQLETLKQRLQMSQDKQRLDSAPVAESLQRQVESSVAPVVEPVQQEAKVIEKPASIAQVAVVEAQAAVAIPVETSPASATAEQPAAQTPVASNKAPGKFKGLFGNAMERFSKLDEKLGSPTKVKVSQEQVIDDVEPALESTLIEVAEPLIQPQVEAQAEVSPAKSAGFANKLGGMLGGLKKAPAKAEPPAEVVELVAEVEPVLEVAAKSGKFGSLLGKFKK